MKNNTDLIIRREDYFFKNYKVNDLLRSYFFITKSLQIIHPFIENKEEIVNLCIFICQEMNRRIRSCSSLKRFGVNFLNKKFPILFSKEIKEGC